MQHPFVSDAQEEAEDSLERNVILAAPSRLLLRPQQQTMTTQSQETVVASKRGKRSRSKEATAQSVGKGRSTTATTAQGGRTTARTAHHMVQDQGNTATTEGEEETQDVPTGGNTLIDAGGDPDSLDHLALMSGLVHSPQPILPRTAKKKPGAQQALGGATMNRSEHAHRVAGLTTAVRPTAQTGARTHARPPHMAPAPHSNVVAGGNQINETPFNVSTQLQFDEPVTATQGVQGDQMYRQPSPPPLFQLGGSNSRSRSHGANQQAGGNRSNAPEQAPLATQQAKQVWEEQMNGFFDFIDRQPLVAVEPQDTK